jgi:hypothetical protein
LNGKIDVKVLPKLDENLFEKPIFLVKAGKGPGEAGRIAMWNPPCLVPSLSQDQLITR